MNTEAPNDKKTFFKKMNNDDMPEVFSQLSEQKNQIQIWKKGDKPSLSYKFVRGPLTENNKLRGEILLKDFIKNINSQNLFSQIPIDLQKVYSLLLKSNEETDNLGDSENLVNITIGNDQYFSRGRLLKVEPKCFLLLLPFEIFKSEKRQSYRLKASPMCTISFTFAEYHFKVNDLSTGGLSFNIGESMRNYFPKDYEIKNGLITLNDATFSIPKSKVVNCIDLTTLNQVKIGLKFLTYSPETEAQLYRRINQELFKIKELNLKQSP